MMIRGTLIPVVDEKILKRIRKGYAHSIKNIHIKHAIVEYEYCGEMKIQYACGMGATKEKIARTLDEVTCKNCLRELEKI